MKKLLYLLVLLLPVIASAKTVTVTLYRVAKSGHGDSVGSVTLVDTAYGMLIYPRLHGLKPGLHGFHVHEYANCGDNGLAAGAHFDPRGMKAHLGPYMTNSHLGDLPALYVSADGKARLPILAPRISVAQAIGHSLMIHAGGDNYSDKPLANGGGGARVACGVIGQQVQKNGKSE